MVCYNGERMDVPLVTRLRDKEKTRRMRLIIKISNKDKTVLYIVNIGKEV